jgi:transcriptional regulator GlxA family with amidase domain
MKNRVDLVKEYVRRYSNTPISTARIARMLNVSPETILREFLRVERTSLRTYMSEVRVEQAKKLLATSDFPCKEICFMVGFTREDVGARVFKRLSGLTMAQYRTTAMSGQVFH